MASLSLPALHRQPGRSVPTGQTGVIGSASRAPARLSALEWSIVALAEHDGIASLREPGRYTRMIRNLFGFRHPNRLANDRLERLRRVAVLAWHQGWNVPKSELVSFLEAGFTSDQFELIQNSVGQARAAIRRRRLR